MLNFLYTTDLHGDTVKYLKLFDIAKEQNVKLIHLGADLLPKGSNILKEQKDFVKGFLKQYYKMCQEKGIQILAFFGNDDCYSRKKYFKIYAELLDEIPFEKDGYIFEAYPYVPDYPFMLKSACKIDQEGWERPKQYYYCSKFSRNILSQICNKKGLECRICQFRNNSIPLDSKEKGLEEIMNIDRYFREKGTIENDLKKFSGGKNKIIAIHCPPANVDLDACNDMKRVGSQAVYEWVRREQPLLVLSGHIHESYKITNNWKAEIGKSIVIQPGQLDTLSVVYVEIDGENVKAQRI